MHRRRVVPLLLAGAGVMIAVRQLLDRDPVASAVLLAIFLLLALLLSRFAFPRPTTAADAARLAADDGAPVIYWREGCQYCLRLRASLGRRASRAHWVNIWADPDAAAELRGYTGGDETVPTVVVGGVAHVNPDPRWVRSQLPR